MKSELEKCLAGEAFNGSDPELAAMTLTAKRLTRQLNDTGEMVLKTICTIT